MSHKQTYFEFYDNLNSALARIRVDESNKTTYRDGGSVAYPVINEDECGWQVVRQDFSIGSKQKGTHGSWTASNDGIKWSPIDFGDIDFV